MIFVLILAPIVYLACLRWHVDRFYADPIRDLEPVTVTGYRIKYLIVSVWVSVVVISIIELVFKFLS